MLYIDQNEFRYVARAETIAASVACITIGLFFVVIILLATIPPIFFDLDIEQVFPWAATVLIVALIITVGAMFVWKAEEYKNYTLKIEDNAKLICQFNEQTVTLEFPCEIKRVTSDKKKGKTELVLNGCIKVCSTDKDANGRTVEEFLTRVVK